MSAVFLVCVANWSASSRLHSSWSLSHCPSYSTSPEVFPHVSLHVHSANVHPPHRFYCTHCVSADIAWSLQSLTRMQHLELLVLALRPKQTNLTTTMPGLLVGMFCWDWLWPFGMPWLDQQSDKSEVQVTPSIDITSPKSFGSCMAAVRYTLGVRFSAHAEHFKSGIAWRKRSGQFSCRQNSCNLDALSFCEAPTTMTVLLTSALARNLGPCSWLAKSMTWCSPLGASISTVSFGTLLSFFQGGAVKSDCVRSGMGTSAEGLARSVSPGTWRHGSWELQKSLIPLDSECMHDVRHSDYGNSS